MALLRKRLHHNRSDQSMKVALKKKKYSGNGLVEEKTSSQEIRSKHEWSTKEKKVLK